MSQFTQRFQPPSSNNHSRDPDVKLRLTPEAYAQENSDAAFVRRHQETQKIKSLSFWDNTDQETSPEDEWSERQSPTPFILVMIILVVASTLLWFLFQWATGENSSTPPIIAADTAPFKVRPENPGGMMIPHQDKLVYGRLSHDASQPIERLLPPPEQPMTAQPMQEQPMTAQPMATQPMEGPHQPYQEQHRYNAPQQGYQAPQGGYSPNPTGQQYQPNQPTGVPYQPYAAQPPQAPYHPTPPSPYDSSRQTAPYGPSQPQAGPILPTHPIPLKTAANPIPEIQPSAVEEVRPAQDVEDDKEVDTPPVAESPNDLERLIAKEAQTPLSRAPKKNNGKNARSKIVTLSKSKPQRTTLSNTPKTTRTKLNRNHKKSSDS